MAKSKKKRYKKDKLQWSERKVKQMLIITALLIVPPFVLWGISTVIQSNKYYYLGKIGNWTITRPIFQRFFQHTNIAFRLSSPSRELPIQLLKEATWQKMFYIYLCKKEHISVSDKELINYIQTIPIFQDENGNFSIDKYNRFLESLGIPGKELEELIREDLMVQKLQDKITKNINVSDEEITQQWKNEKEEYHLSYLHIRYDKFYPQIQISEKEIEDYYQKNKEDMIIPKKVKLQYITVESDKKISPQKDLEKLAKELGVSVKETGFITSSDILPDIGISNGFYTYAFSLERGQTSPVFSIENGKQCILKVISVKPKHIGELNEVKDRIVKELKHQKAKSLAKEKVKKLLESPANIKWDDKILIHPSYPYAPKLGPIKPIIDKIRKDKPAAFDSESHPIYTIEQPNSILLIKINKFISAPEQIPPKEKQKIKEQILNQKKAEKFQKYIQQMMEKTIILRKDSK